MRGVGRGVGAAIAAVLEDEHDTVSGAHESSDGFGDIGAPIDADRIGTESGGLTDEVERGQRIVRELEIELAGTPVEVEGDEAGAPLEAGSAGCDACADGAGAICRRDARRIRGAGVLRGSGAASKGGHRGRAREESESFREALRHGEYQAQ